MRKFYFVLFYCTLPLAVFAQNQSEIIQKYLDNNYENHNVKLEDVQEWKITDQHISKQSGANYVYIQQEYQGIGISNGVAGFTIKDGEVFNMSNRLVNDINQKIRYTAPSLNPYQAITLAAAYFDMDKPEGLKILEVVSTQHYIYSKGGISHENIPVKLMYYANSNQEIILVWDLSINSVNTNNWWSVKVDAHSGEILDQYDWTVHCNLDHTANAICNHRQEPTNVNPGLSPAGASPAPDGYRVFAIPLESPNHGARTLITNPADTLASKFGWHDTNGVAGAEFTITRGNNVFAYEDEDNDNNPGFSPDGGNGLDFDFPLNTSNAPNTYQPAAITNLFYMNNIMHDVWYQYGYDEASGNFQANNYGNGGFGDDYVNAEAQDGGGTNNANFGTPPDGGNPRMQMYLWSSSAAANYLEINDPAIISGTYNATGASFGPGLPVTPITADVVLVEDNIAPINDGCDSIVNGGLLTGKIALIDRGNCTFVNKVLNAEAEGALAVIIVNNVVGNPIQMGGTNSSITIPSIMISMADGNLIKAQLVGGGVNATISDGGVANSSRDGDFDNGIIAHEYGHGISNRLTGGGNNVNCLGNAEQMGEGWSDWFGLMITMEPGDQGDDIRGIGTFASNQPITGQGIRPAPYSTDFVVNSYTYGASNNGAQISQPHGVGFIFATVLWDLNWALIDEYGGTFDPDVYNGTGGNNIAMQLVIEGLKLQPCGPGMIDGRDAILQADQLLYGGLHRCLIWEVFAKRGFGFSASQGSAGSRSDQVEAFDLPTFCLIATAPPVAAFTPSSLNSCIPTIQFTDNSTDIPQTWSWDFGDGNTSNLQNPTHTFNGSGVYSVKLVVTNNIGNDSTTIQVTITLPPSPGISDTYVCEGDTALLIANPTGTAQWRDVSNTVIHTGDTLVVPNVTSQQKFFVQNLVGGPSSKVGPADSSIGGGGIHSSGFHGALNFTANKGFEIVSALIIAGGAGPRTIIIGSGTNQNGNSPSNVVDQVTVNLVDGPQRVYLNMTIPSAGNYNIGANNVDLFRNNSGANYPYTLPGFLTITSSSATTNPTGYYYYLYDIEVRDLQCVSEPDSAIVGPVTSKFGFTNVGNAYNFTDSSSGAINWFWTFGDGNTSSLQNPGHTYGAPGTYTVTLTVNNGCTSTQTVSIPVGIGNDPALPQITLMPNPTDGTARLVLDKAMGMDLDIRLTDINGKTIQIAQLLNGNIIHQFDLTLLPSAVYLIEIKGEQFTEIKKLIKE